RMYPSAVFPDFIRDGAKAVKFVAERLKSWGGNGKIYISGHSAGAYISMMLCLDTKYLKDENLTPGDIDGWVIDSAQQTTHYNVLRERGEYTGLQRIDEAAPMFFVSPKTSFSKMLLLFYTEDIACRYEQNMLLYKAILNCNANAQIEYRVLNGQHCSDLRVETDGGDLFADILSEYVLKN
ncbi:MAG: alpha/beta hydrolase, partial [Candidatus Scatosoma sp.]